MCIEYRYAYNKQYQRTTKIILKSKMNQGYLSKYSKKNSQMLPSILKRIKPIDSTLQRLKQPTQQSLLLELQDIDQSLHNKNFSIRHGFLFSKLIDERIVNQLHACLKKQNSVMEEGFALWGCGLPGDEHPKRLCNKLETLNQRLVKQSFQNVYNYDMKKYMQIMKINRKKWSLFKRTENQGGHYTQDVNEPRIENKKQTLSLNKLKHQNNYKQPLQSINASITESTLINNISKIRTPQSAAKTPTVHSKYTSSNQSRFQGNIQKRNNNSKQQKKRRMLTEIPELDNPQNESHQISKNDIKHMLKKQQNNLISIWLPPATYPQFHGMFTYLATKKVSVCRLKKYFFFRRSLNQRFFISILEEISAIEDRYIEGLEIVTNKTDYQKVYEPIGWRMKSVEGMDKIRLRFTRDKQ